MIAFFWTAWSDIEIGGIYHLPGSNDLMAKLSDDPPIGGLYVYAAEIVEAKP